MSDKPYYGPDQPEYDTNLERFFLAGDFVSGVGYGVQLVLYVTCALYLWKQRRRGGKTLFLLAYITLLLAVSTIFAIVQARTVQDIYIENRNYPGGPWQYFLATQSLAINVLFYATLFIMTFLCDLLVLWRCWIIWTASGRRTAWLVILFPSLMLVASFAMGTLWTLQSSQPGLSMYSKDPMAFGTAYYTISLGVNVILTVLIIIRLLMYRRTHLAHLPVEHGKQYLSLATLIIESAALYSVFAIMFLVSYAIAAPINQIWLGCASAAQQIATYLIIYRVAQGRAWTKDALESRTLTSLNFRERPGRELEQKTDERGRGIEFTSRIAITDVESQSQIDDERQDSK